MCSNFLYPTLESVFGFLLPRQRKTSTSQDSSIYKLFMDAPRRKFVSVSFRWPFLFVLALNKSLPMAVIGRNSMTEAIIKSTEISSEEGKQSLKELQDALLHTEFLEMENGDRKYDNKALDNYVLPLLQNLGLAVSRTESIKQSSADKVAASWLYSHANFESYRYQEQNRRQLYHPHSKDIPKPTHYTRRIVGARVVRLP